MPQPTALVGMPWIGCGSAANVNAMACAKNYATLFKHNSYDSRP